MKNLICLGSGSPVLVLGIVHFVDFVMFLVSDCDSYVFSACVFVVSLPACLLLTVLNLLILKTALRHNR